MAIDEHAWQRWSERVERRLAQVRTDCYAGALHKDWVGLLETFADRLEALEVHTKLAKPRVKVPAITNRL